MCAKKKNREIQARIDEKEAKFERGAPTRKPGLLGSEEARLLGSGIIGWSLQTSCLRNLPTKG